MSSVVLAVTGLTKEARIAAGPGVITIAGGGNRAALEARLAAIDPRTLRAVVSFGIAGALDPALRVGDIVLTTEIMSGAGAAQCASRIRDGWAKRLEAGATPFAEAPIVGVDEPLMNAAEKAALRARTGAAAVDMESHIAIAYAAKHGLPFGALRVISDSADHTLPPAAGKAMRPDGSVDLVAVLVSVLRQPGQIPALVATGRDASAAFRALRRVGRLLSLRGGLVGLDL